MPVTIIKAVAVLLTLQLAAANLKAQTTYQDSIRSWREKQEAELISESGWLTLVGLFWLKEGANSIGSHPSSDIVLPGGSAPDRVGNVEFQDGKAVLRVANGVTVLRNGSPITELEMSPDTSKKLEVLTVGELTMLLIKRGERYGIRLKNKNSLERRQFPGLRWFPIRHSYRITADFVAYEQPKSIPIANVLGDINMMVSPGYVTFNLGGQVRRLEPVVEEGKLLFIFRDTTSGKSTYPAGRFLYTERAKDGKLILDFNQAVNPPCAFTRFATCPLPPKQNNLRVAVRAGALNYEGHKEGASASR